MRVSHFTPPSDPAAPLGDADDGWPADDIDGWLDSVVDGIEISNRENVTVGGLEAADTGLFIIDRDIEGNPISTIDELIAALTSGSTTATEIEPATLGGFDARVFDIEKPASTPDAPLLLPAGADENGWRAPLAGRIWASETDRGLVMITANAFELASDLEVSPGQSELLVSTLEFIELG